MQLRVLVEREVLRVADDADDRAPVVVAELDPLADRRLARPRRVGERFVHDDHARRAGAIRLRDVAAEQHRNAHRLEVVGRDRVDQHLRLVAGLDRRLAFDRDRV